MNWTATNNRRRIRDQGAETVNGASFGGNRPPAPDAPPAAADRSTSRRAQPTLPGPIEIAKYWKSARNRKQTTVIAIKQYEGHTFLDCRLFDTNGEGQSVPTARGLTVGMARLLEFEAAVSKAVRKARELGLIVDQDGTSEPSEAAE
jgi:hypothetical protein